MVQLEYGKKRMTADQAVSLIPEKACVVHGMAAGEPPALLAALAERARSGAFKEVKVFSLLPMAHAANTILSPDLSDVIFPHTWFVSASDRAMVQVGLNTFVPNNFHEVPRLIADTMEIDAVITTVSPMDQSGYFTFGAVNDYISTAARHAKKLIVEVNPEMPRVFGDSLIHISEVNAVVVHRAPLMEITPAPPKPEAEVIGRTIAEMIPDGATLQLGVGGIPNAVTAYLENHRDLGIHTELFCPGMVDLIQKGIVTGKKKNIHPRKHVFTNALGDKSMYQFMDNNPSMESYPVSYTNDPRVIARNDRMISINSTIEVDLLGQCNSEVLGGHQYSGTGGQLDFVRGAYDSRGGKSIIAFYSTAGNGEISRIVPRFEVGAVVTTPRMATEYLVTEYGAINLKGLSTQERVLGIINLAHPRFRDDLLREAENMCLI